jgi:anti-sigma B factor antagonist
MAPQGAFPVSFNDTESVVVVATIGANAQLDAEGSKSFGDTVVRYINAHPGVKLLINFQNITYLSSAALSELLRVNDAAKQSGGAIQLCGLSKEIHRVFEITQLSKVFKVNPGEPIEKTIVRLNSESEWDVFRA